jgi:hypothetical protein
LDVTTRKRPIVEPGPMMPVGVPCIAENKPKGRGRPKGSVSLKTHLRKLLDTNLLNEPAPLVEGTSRDMAAGEKMMLNLVVKAVADASMNAIKTVLERRAEPRCKRWPTPEMKRAPRGAPSI